MEELLFFIDKFERLKDKQQPFEFSLQTFSVTPETLSCLQPETLLHVTCESSFFDKL